jgi:hypothetical protein
MHKDCMHEGFHGRVCHRCAAVRDWNDGTLAFGPWRSSTDQEKDANIKLGRIMEFILQNKLMTPGRSFGVQKSSDGSRLTIELHYTPPVGVKV